MRRQWWIAQALTCSVLAGASAVAGTASAWADGPGGVPAARSGTFAQASDATALMTAEAAENARKEVRRLATSHPLAEVRVSAWNALRSEDPEAIAKWFAPDGGYEYARGRARTTRARNKAFIERVIRTHTKSYSPEVRAAAERALKGTPAEQATFVRTGYAEAQKHDRAQREADTQHKQEVAEAEREVVRRLAEDDPGEQVRTAAQWALRAGATDEDVAEFFGYGWVSGAALDLESRRSRIADAETVRHHTLTRLIQEAAAAEEAVKGASDAAKARAEAERAWQAVAEHADAARKAWQAERAAAETQSANWQTVAERAKNSADGIWKNINESAKSNCEAWSKEQADAAESAAFWQNMFDRAKEGESRAKG
ncbi:ALF repeat-containing protein [Streptomyces sp. NPDC018045]|uniref:ALF repeat-containing protein n=1 Tax=Streptomyces sp. NPDC018045 TaxID=3365037 RepID=UPI0037ADBE43